MDFDPDLHFGLSSLTLNQPHIHFFEKLAPLYDFLLDLLTLGGYATFLRKAIKVLAPKQGERILDLCSGTGRVASWVAEAVGAEGNVIGMDVARNMIEVARQRYGGGLGNAVFLQRDVVQPWEDQKDFDGIFASFAIHELPEKGRIDVLKQSYSVLQEKGRLVIADFNPQASGMARHLSLLFFNLFERRNLNFFGFHQNETLRQIGFKRIKTFSAFGGILQITLAYKN